MEKFVKEVQTIKADKVLDVATGRGEFITFLRENLKEYSEITGIDSDAKVLEIAREQFQNSDVFFKNMEVEKIDYEDRNFGVVSISNSLHHLKNLDRAFAEIHRVLKPSGYILINEMISDGNQSASQKNHIAVHHWAAAIERKRGKFHSETFSKAEVKKIILDQKIQNPQIYEYSHRIKNPKDEKLIGNLTSKIDQFIQILSKQKNADRLIEQGKKIKRDIEEFGFASARSLFIISRM